MPEFKDMFGAQVDLGDTVIIGVSSKYGNRMNLRFAKVSEFKLRPRHERQPDGSYEQKDYPVVKLVWEAKGWRDQKTTVRRILSQDEFSKRTLKFVKVSAPNAGA